MDLFQAITLGIIQGLTEFLPISSSAHLVLAPYVFSWPDSGLTFDVALHMGTLLAVILFFWKDWLAMFRQLRRPALSERSTLAWQHVVVGTLPAVFAGVFLHNYVETTFRSPLLIAGTLSVFALLLWFWDRKGAKTRDVGQSTWRDALIIGVAQAMALVPGVSRSGVTVTAALALGMTRTSAARFSFLLSAPITAGAGLMKAKDISGILAIGGADGLALAAGFGTSVVSGLLAIGLLSKLLRTGTFTGFVVYRLLLALTILGVIFVVGGPVSGV